MEKFDEVGASWRPLLQPPPLSLNHDDEIVQKLIVPFEIGGRGGWASQREALVAPKDELAVVNFQVRAYVVSPRPRKESAYPGVVIVDDGVETEVQVELHSLQSTRNCSMKSLKRNDYFVCLLIAAAHSPRKS